MLIKQNQRKRKIKSLVTLNRKRSLMLGSLIGPCSLFPYGMSIHFFVTKSFTVAQPWLMLFFFVLFFPQLTEENVYSVLCFADVYLLNGLKRLCARVITSLLDIENVFTVLRTARLFNLPKLEVDCCEFISRNLEKVRTRRQSTGGGRPSG